MTSLLSATALAALMALPAAAFQRDAHFTDAEGDMIADIPTDASHWVDPSVLIFAYTPVEDPAADAEAWSDFLTHMQP
jgi:phosphonate transport system substrate-binding protein